MTFTYTPSATPNDITLIRFYLRDTVEANAIWTDEEIEMVIAQEPTRNDAIIALIDNLIMQFSSTPDYRADWLQESFGGSVDRLRAYRRQLASKFGLGFRTRTGNRRSYRADTPQNLVGTPEYDYTDADWYDDDWGHPS